MRKINFALKRMMPRRGFFWMLGWGLFFAGIWWGVSGYGGRFFFVKYVDISGAERSQRNDIIEILKKENLMRPWFSLAKAYQDLKGLPWVQQVSLRRRFPQGLQVSIKERIPMALWQDMGKTYVVDGQGQMISGVNVEAFSHLPVITGIDAPLHFQNLQETLKRYGPRLILRGASRERASRWNVYIERSQNISPAEGGLLAQGEKDGGSLEKNFILIKLPPQQLAKTLAILNKNWEDWERMFGVIDARMPQVFLCKPLKKNQATKKVSFP